MALLQPEFNDVASRNDAHFGFLASLPGHSGAAIPMPEAPTPLKARALALPRIKQEDIAPCAVTG